jgi:hypothetical protein
MFDRLRQCGLLRETELAASVMCYNCGHPHPEEVIYLDEALFGRTRPHIVCPDEGLIEVDIDDMRQWLVDRQTLVRMLAAALEAAGHIEQVVPNRVWSLGRRHLGGRFRDFFFVAGAARPDGPAVMANADRIGSVAAPVILVPSKPPRHEQWKNPALSLFCLSQVAELGEGRLDLDLDYIEDTLPRDRAASPAKTVRGVSLPDGTQWKDLAVEVADGALVAFVGGIRKEISYDYCRFGVRGDVSLRGGRIVQVGSLPAEGVLFPANSVMARELDYVGVFRAAHAFDWAVQALRTRRVDVRPLISAQLPIAQARAVFELAADRSRSTKVQLVVE